MWGKAYDMHRHTGRMVRDPSMRMTNKAEVGFGMVGLIGMAIIFLLALAVFL